MSGAETKTLPPHMTQGDVDALLEARHDRPFDVLGVHKSGRAALLVALVPVAVDVVAVVGRRARTDSCGRRWARM